MLLPNIVLMRLCSLLLLGLATFLASGCAGNRSTPAPDPSLPEPAPLSVAELVNAVLTQPPEADTLAVLDRLPPPNQVTVDTVQNIHVPSQIDTLRTYRYDGLAFTVYFAPEKELMRDIRVTSPAYASPEGLQVGDARAEVEATLGPPDERDGDAYVYELTQTVPNLLRVEFQNDTVAALEWLFYID